MRKIKHLNLNEDIVKLKEYFESECINPGAFARKHGICPMTILKVSRGHDCRLSTALAIQTATKGMVTCTDMWPTQPGAYTRPKPKALDKNTTKDLQRRE